MKNEMKSQMEKVQETRDLLNEEVAIRLLGYRWVVWKSTDGFPVPSEEKGRFLAPPDGPMAPDQVPAAPGVPFAKEPDRDVPMFTTDLMEAFDVARNTGLFAAGKAHLNLNEFGEWSVGDEDGRIWSFGPSLPEAICRAALQWYEVSNGGTG